MNYKVSIDHLIDMVTAQERLNEKYNGVGWRREVKLGLIKMALIEEMAEMGQEINATWKWWSPVDKNTMDKSKATFEFIDVLHFALQILLYRNSVNSINDVLMAEPYIIDPDMGGNVSDPHHAYIQSVTRFLSSIDVDNKEMSIRGVRNIIETGSVLLDISGEDIYAAYMMKNKRNHQRVDGGVMVGKYDKTKEVELTL